MLLQRTVKIRLDIQPKALRDSVDAYTKGFNYVCRFGWDNQITSRVPLHHATYTYLREEFNLPSQLAISVIGKAVEALKSAKARLKNGKKASCPQSKHCPIRYDARSYTLKLAKQTVSLLTTNGRVNSELHIPEYYEQYLDWDHRSADLVIRNNKVYLHIVFQSKVADPSKDGQVIGIDRGVKKLAVVSNNKFFSGTRIKEVSNKIQTLRNNLQSVGTRSAKRHLAKLRGKEQRFRKDVNHCVSKQIVDSILAGSTIVLEKLSGIRDRCKFAKKVRSQIHRWNFFQLETFLAYKAFGKGIDVLHIDPRNTSRTCSKCGHCSKSNRKSQCSFKCEACDYSLNADLNASRNIRNKHLMAIRCNDGAEMSTSLLLSV